MTVVECVGYSLIAFGPSFAIFWVIIVGQPSRLVVFLVSSFFWFLSLLLSSVAWILMRELFNETFAVAMVTSVCFQELFRYLAFLTLRKAEKELDVVKLVGNEFDASLIRYHCTYACASGLGFGAASAASAMLNLLADVAAGPGTMGFFGDHDSLDYVLFSATASCFSLLHTMWSVIASHALLFQRRCVFLFVPAAHMFTSGMTMLTEQAHQDVLYKVLPLTAVGAVLYMTAVTAFVVSGGTPRNLLSCLGALLGDTTVASDALRRPAL
ncbi:hypothetical protein HPB50_003719 [Hyalomma asiaticum]|uniref:Uncharacterized protein n=1 Tax=Hyalomma asiaticum TaxID=266040 RepID=A0ACB7SSY1_HYAAI|nr:hypothetical protein HPB50_003719 [Hyalomma asiaticum]